MVWSKCLVVFEPRAILTIEHFACSLVLWKKKSITPTYSHPKVDRFKEVNFFSAMAWCPVTRKRLLSSSHENSNYWKWTSELGICEWILIYSLWLVMSITAKLCDVKLFIKVGMQVSSLLFFFPCFECQYWEARGFVAKCLAQVCKEEICALFMAVLWWERQHRFMSSVFL